MNESLGRIEIGSLATQNDANRATGEAENPVSDEESPCDNLDQRQDINVTSPPVNALSIMRYLIPWSRRPVLSPSLVNEPERNRYESVFFLLWPPNLFAFTSMLLATSGAYARITRPNERPMEWDDQEWSVEISDVAEEWRKLLNTIPSFDFISASARKISTLVRSKNQVSENDFDAIVQPEHMLWKKQAEGKIPEKVLEYWNAVFADLEQMGKGDVFDMWSRQEKGKRLFRALLSLHAITDETCKGWGIRRLTSVTWPEKAEKLARSLLSQFGTLATVYPDRGRVLPKRHSPQIGITLHAVSGHLAFHRSSIQVKWEVEGPAVLRRQEREDDVKKKGAVPVPAIVEAAAATRKILSMLLLPWPLEVHARDFREVPPDEPRKGKKNSGGRWAMFQYQPMQRLMNQIEDQLPRILREARKEVDTIDIVVLPEAALTLEEVERLQAILGISANAYIVGVRETQKGGKYENAVCYSYRELAEDKVASWVKPQFQKKHHRWHLTPWQIKSYQLGVRLHPDDNWWENIEIDRREVRLINFGDELTICPLICEDLARQDPVADLVRAIGPSLVVAILMDGPQVRSRWSATYASVLADDPGSSVLTLTSYGMVQRYEVPAFDGGIRSKSNVVGLWRDQENGAREIVLEEGAKAVLLSLAVKEVSEHTLDGRSETGEGTYTLTFGGIHQIRV